MIIAGMGGELISDIICNDFEKSKSFSKFVLQPRTYYDELRLDLQFKGFELIDYKLAKEKGRICEVFSVHYSGESFTDNKVISDKLLKSNDPLLCEYIQYKINSRENVLANLINANDYPKEKVAALKEEIKFLNSL